MADKSAGLFASKKSKFLAVTLLGGGLSIYGMQFLRHNNPKTYNKVVWEPFQKTLYPFMLAMTVRRIIIQDDHIELEYNAISVFEGWKC
jgi:hypothetical protein